MRERTSDQRNHARIALGDLGLEPVGESNLRSVPYLEDRLKHALLLLEKCGVVRQVAQAPERYALTENGHARLQQVMVPGAREHAQR